MICDTRTPEQAAKILFQCYGDTAWLEASQRADAALADGRLADQQFWIKTLTLLEKQYNGKPSRAEATGLLQSNEFCSTKILLRTIRQIMPIRVDRVARKHGSRSISKA